MNVVPMTAEKTQLDRRKLMLKLKKLIESNISVAPPDIDIRRPIAGKDIDYEGPEKSYEIALDFNDDYDMFHKLYVMYKTKMNKLQRAYLKTHDIEIEDGTLNDDESGGIIGIKEIWVKVEEGNSQEVELFCSIVQGVGGFNDANISAEDNDFPSTILPAFEELHKKDDITVSEDSIWIAPAECTSKLLYTILRELHSLRTGLNEKKVKESKSGAEHRAISNKIKAARFQTPQDAGIKKHDARSSEMEMKYEFIKTVRDRFQAGSKDYKTCDDILEYCIDRMSAPTPGQQDLLIKLYMKAV